MSAAIGGDILAQRPPPIAALMVGPGGFVYTFFLLALLAGVAMFLLYQLRREKRNTVAPRPRVAVPARPPDVEPLAAPSISVSVTPPPMTQAPALPAAVPVRKPGKRSARRPLASVGEPGKTEIADATPTTPIAGVLRLLKDRDALASAFLLQEIIARPLAHRHAPAR
jgi:hypothetical protein